MAKDDYFVLVYKILSYLYECFKAGVKPDKEEFDASALHINPGYWVNVMESMRNEGYITGIFIPKTPAMGVRLLDLKITEKGIVFLQDNSNVQKAKEFLKTITDFIPGY